jgi:hypothetical protein
MRKTFSPALPAFSLASPCLNFCWKAVIARLAAARHTGLMLPDEQASPEQIKILRAMSGQKRLALAQDIYWSARKIKAAGLRYQHPDWPEERVNAEVTRIFLNARS